MVLFQQPDDSTGFEITYSGQQLHDLVRFLSHEEFNDAVEELESSGLVEADKMLGTAPYTFGQLSPTFSLFLHFKGGALGYDPFDDICAVAAAAAAKNEVERHDLHELTRISPVRLNRAVAYLDAYQYASVLRTAGTAPFDFNSVSATRRTREFVKEHCR
jgi:hypothetical protein